MSRVENVYKSSDYSKETTDSYFDSLDSFYGFENKSWKNTLSDLGNDATSVGNALASFPYSSALKIIGFCTVLYIGFKVVNKFVSIEKTVKQFARRK